MKPVVYCPGCEGIVGQDCFNVEECVAIAADIQASQQAARDEEGGYAVDILDIVYGGRL